MSGEYDAAAVVAAGPQQPGTLGLCPNCPREWHGFPRDAQPDIADDYLTIFAGIVSRTVGLLRALGLLDDEDDR